MAAVVALPVRHLSKMINDNVASFSDRLRSDNSLDAYNFGDMGFFRLECLKGKVAVVPVRISLKKVLRL